MKSLSDIIAVLGKKLSDHDIQRFFPKDNPGEIRRLLLGESKPLEAEKAVPRQSSMPFSPKISAGELQLFTDGASRGNPGEAGAGAVIQNSQGEELLACGEYLGQCTNNVAEYKALILGLKKIQEMDGRQVAVFMDSELIIRQLQGRYKVKNANLKPLFDQAKQLLNSLDTYRVAHIPREKNKRADELANEGIDNRRYD